MSKLPLELSVGQVATRSGLPVSTIHFYETKGLIKSERNRGNHRRYGRDVLRRVAVVKVAQRAGIPLKEIAKVLASLPDGRAPDAHDWEDIASHWKHDLDDRIERLVRLRDKLSLCIGCGCLSIDRCPLRNPNDDLAEEGAGPRLLDPQ
jgi:MerR family redox-sensitive transcriptional activator SoxR